MNMNNRIFNRPCYLFADNYDIVGKFLYTLLGQSAFITKDNKCLWLCTKCSATSQN